MKYISTRNKATKVSASQAILQGLAPDGGLYVPEAISRQHWDWNLMKNYTYQEMAYTILSQFFDDFSQEDLQEIIALAYDKKFDDPLIAPIKKCGERYYLELFHGATIAFKDMALSILPYLVKKAAEINGNHNEIIVLTATSGDTGKAAMAGFQDVPGTKIIVFYPKGGVSSIQERQMVTQKGENTFVVAVKGNFDDAQTQVKALFNDTELREQLAKEQKQFSSANSMNIGRLIPQVVYYFYAYSQLIKRGELKVGDKMNVSVPTGNFGNILAAYYAKTLGLPIDQFICASNDNTVLYDFFSTGSYDKRREFKLTISPSMDILISSNLERLLFYAVGEDTQKLTELMQSLDDKGYYTVSESNREVLESFIGQFATEEETLEEIHTVYRDEDYVIDPHTAVASKCWRKVSDQLEVPTVIVSTASPYKFPEAVLRAIAPEKQYDNDEERLEAIKALSHVPFPPAIEELKSAPIRHRLLVTIDEMRETVITISQK